VEQFAQTFLDNLPLRQAKLPDLKTHPCFAALNSVYDGEAKLPALVVFDT
jgi:hypothetical protein